MIMNTIKAIAGEDLKEGDIVYLVDEKKHWLKRLVSSLAFWYTPKKTAYMMEEVTETSFTYEVNG